MKEQLPAARYEIFDERPSVFDPKMTIRESRGYICPRCRSLLGEIGQRKSVVCKGCSLQVTVVGNSMYCEGEA